MGGLLGALRSGSLEEAREGVEGEAREDLMSHEVGETSRELAKGRAGCLLKSVRSRGN